MVLTLDIQKKAEPIIRHTNKGAGANLLDTTYNLGEGLSDLILTVEGFDDHVFALEKTKVKKLLDETNKVITVFINIDEHISSVTLDKEVTERFKYSLKAMYKLRSLLHLAYTKDIAVKRTPDNVREGLSAISRTTALHSAAY